MTRFFIPVSKLKPQYLSHPSPFSIQAYSDTLDVFGISNMVAELEFDDFTEINEPIIASLKSDNGEEFGLVKKKGDGYSVLIDSQTRIISQEDLRKVWSGTLLAVDSNSFLKWISEIFKEYWSKGIIVLFIWMYALITLVGWQSYVIFFTSQVAIFLLMQLKRETQNENLESRFCKKTDKIDCKSVTQSEWAVIAGGIGLFDLGISYFIVLTAWQLFNPTFPFLQIATVGGLFFIGYSVIIQHFVLKKWCLYCLGVALVFVLQIAISFDISFNSFLEIRLNHIISSSLWFVVGLSIWKVVDEHLSKESTLVNTMLRLNGFQRNNLIFHHYFKGLAANLPLDGLQTLRIMGGPQSPLNLTLIINSNCTACIEAYKSLIKLVREYESFLQISLVFMVPPDQVSKEEAGATLARLFSWQSQLDETEFEKLINDWLVLKKIPPVSDHSGSHHKSLEEVVDNQLAWCQQHQITLTPTLLINGKLYPYEYRIEDLRYLMPAVLELEVYTQRVLVPS